ncbi:unnamed protein product [Heterobilharzia americana]|nr:unnamed protein product [Heterobilharzia americana]
MTENKNSTDISEVLPPSLAAVRDIFAEFNVSDVSDEICTRVLDVLYRHTCDVIEEAKAVSHHAGRSKIEEDDIQLAINSVTDGLMFAPPYRDQLLAYAEKNEQPLPAIRPHCGIRLPAERFNLTAPNYSLVSCVANGKTNPSSEFVSDSSITVHIPNPMNSTKGIFRAMNPQNRPINVGNPMGSSVHVIAAPGIGPSMIRVQTVQNVAQLSNVDNSGTGLRTLSVGPTISNGELRKSFRRPVFLFVHGESYEFGSGNAYDLSVLASYSDAIGITLNYRLGILGFLSTNNDGINGNFALYDLHGAIMWIKTNIESFNGDPNEITLIGYGYGAALVHLFALSKMSQGTSRHGIKRIILLNGSGFALWATSHHTSSILAELMKHFNITMENFKNNLSTHQVNQNENQNNDYVNKQKSLFAQNQNLDPFKNLSSTIQQISDSSINGNSTLLKLKLKNSSVELLINLQNNLSHPLVTTRFGPVISKHLFPSYLLHNSDGQHYYNNNNNESKNLSRSSYTYSQQPKQWNENQFSDTVSELKYSTVNIPAIETSLFMNTDLMVGWTESPASDLYYIQSALHKMQYSSLLGNIIKEIYPNNQKVIKEIVEHIYCGLDEAHLDYNLDNDDYVKGNRGQLAAESHSDRTIKDTQCYRKIQDILSDGLYIAPIMQTMNMHANHQANQETDKGTQQPSTSSTSLFPKRKQHEMFNGKDNRMDKVGFGDDLPYLLGAPFVSPNQLEPFANSFTETDKKISVSLMSYLTNFIYYGDPNKEFLGHRTKKIPIHWPEYTPHSKHHLNVGSEFKKKQSFDQTRRHFRNLWENTEKNEQNLFTIEQFYENHKHKIWSKLFPRLTYLAKSHDSFSTGFNQDRNKENTEQPSHYKQHLFNEYFYFLRLKQENWLNDQGNEKKSTIDSVQYNDQNVMCSAKFVEDNKPFQAYINTSEVSYAVNFSQLPLYTESGNDDYSNTVVMSTSENNNLLVNFNSSVEFHSNIESLDKEIQSNSQFLISGYSSYSHSTLLWIIGAGSILFLLNTLIFIAIYHQTHQSRSVNLPQQSKSTMKTSSIVPGNEELDALCQKPLHHTVSLNKKESWSMQYKDARNISNTGVNGTGCSVQVFPPSASSSVPKCYQKFDFNAYCNPNNPLLGETSTNAINMNITTDNNNSSNENNDVNLMNSWYSESPSVIGQSTNTIKTRYLHPYHQQHQNIRTNIY